MYVKQYLMNKMTNYLLILLTENYEDCRGLQRIIFHYMREDRIKRIAGVKVPDVDLDLTRLTMTSGVMTQ